jgi:hypothetical protein
MELSSKIENFNLIKFSFYLENDSVSILLYDLRFDISNSNTAISVENFNTKPPNQTK